MSNVLTSSLRATADNAGTRAIEVLVVDDDPGDRLLTKEALESGKVCNHLSFAKDGIEALEFLRQEGEFADASRPDLILLDLNMPRMDGRGFLEHVKADARFDSIPVVVLTTSEADQDILKSYKLQANCYVTKPVDLDQFTQVVRSIEDFWFCVVKFPPQ
jgi:CheY-like chemotaxis protein